MKHMKDVDVKEFERNELLQDSMMFRLIQISENSKKLSDSFKLVEHPVIPWTAIYGVNYSAIELPEHRVGTA